MRYRISGVVILGLLGLMTAAPVSADLPVIPDALGRGGAQVGVSNDVLLVAGGTNFRDGVRSWNGGVKVWHDTVFALTNPNGSWKTCQTRLPRGLGYAVSITTPAGVWCIGGCDETRHRAECFVMSWRDGDIVITPQPSLPEPVAYGCGALVGTRLYVAGGSVAPDSVKASNRFYELDLAQPTSERKWIRLESWPGPERMLAMAGSAEGRFFLFGGVQLTTNEQGKPDRIRPCLKDACSYEPSSVAGQSGVWKRLADLPVSRAAAPTPVPHSSAGQLAILSGDEGDLLPELRDEHPGFTPSVLLYDLKLDQWKQGQPLEKSSSKGDAFWPAVTTGCVPWNDKFVVPSGEVRPGVRTSRVMTWPAE